MEGSPFKAITLIDAVGKLTCPVTTSLLVVVVSATVMFDVDVLNMVDVPVAVRLSTEFATDAVPGLNSMLGHVMVFWTK